ncbi:MAG: hypothetical protein MJ252_06195 [archaeon]|nr:hypothetical protein [archaeon]
MKSVYKINEFKILLGEIYRDLFNINRSLYDHKRNKVGNINILQALLKKHMQNSIWTKPKEDQK